MANDPLTELRALFQEERGLLLAGKLNGLVGLADRKAAVLPRLAGANAAALRGLQAQASENHRLLRAVQDGLRAAITRLAAIRTANEGLTSSAADGRTSPHGALTCKVERRA